MTKELRVSHVEKLKTVLKNGYNQNSHMLMAVHADCNLADFNPNDVTYKVIGGNHTRCALIAGVEQRLRHESTIVYCNLTYVEALSLCLSE